MFGPADAAPADEDRAGQLQAVASPTGSLSAGTLEQNAPHMTPGLAGRQLSSDGTGSPDERKRTGQQKTRERNRRARAAAAMLKTARSDLDLQSLHTCRHSTPTDSEIRWDPGAQLMQ